VNLYLVRHAEPKSEAEDRLRPLSEKGWSDIRKVAAFICAHSNIEINVIMHSPKTRARQTAEALAKCLNPPEGIKEAPDITPLDDPSIWAERLAKTKEDTMLVGHLPHLGRLSSLLLCQNENRAIIDFQAGGAVCMKRNESISWRLRWMVIPQML
jgi:phosphohistidine phosphatase